MFFLEAQGNPHRSRPWVGAQGLSQDVARVFGVKFRQPLFVAAVAERGGAPDGIRSIAAKLRLRGPERENAERAQDYQRELDGHQRQARQAARMTPAVTI